MSFFPPLDHIHRRSSSFIYPQSFSEFMEYASSCRDELQVYLHMEENGIGIDDPNFWLALLQTLKERCQFKLLIKKLTQIKKIISHSENPDFIKIISFEEMLTRQLENEICKRKKNKRRSVREFQLFSISKLLKKTRKVGDGSFQLYVDQENRQKYKLNDLSQFILDEMKEYIDGKIKKYQQKRANREWSFLGKKQDGLKILSNQLIDTNRRNSEFMPICQLTNGRLSNQQRTAEKRLSAAMARRSNIIENNPEKDLHKTPIAYKKQKVDQNLNEISIRKLTSSKNQCERQRDVFTTPTMKHPTISKSIMKANGKNQKRDNEGGQTEVNELQKELQWLSSPDELDMDVMDYPGQKEVIRQQQNQRQAIPRDGEIQIYDGDDTETQYQQLDMARLENTNSDQSQSLECYYKQQKIINCLKSTITYQSLDSNNENIFSNEKQMPSNEQRNNFRRPGNQLKLIQTQDLQQRQNPQWSSSDLSISQIQKVQTCSSEAQQYQQFLDIDDGMHRFNLNENENLVLETMRKKKINQIRESQKRRQNKHPNGIHTEIKLPTRLAHISEELSYNSEKKYTSRQRLSSGIYRDQEDQQETK